MKTCSDMTDAAKKKEIKGHPRDKIMDK